ncbi:Zinc Finger Protein C2H2-like protein [Scheffersomyces stipitis CBS 6054]|uniref:Zinc Finger Protein C2H2-like protein n=1 Tax=Scheffersomyces stipitis (strain ATCC 58785 / CBS 6054 / NBRC 10063 / NRRL Y-11545) TaxID=322104 RepID=A3GI42_PICST|nr:Zinc Finger Protein C2H2-like protein [Scheffersomyces stipitis CBS 6054]EAZ63169.2 Zinc Finger Protein C2H2-like protein [Scheffersomyces stipitis CBS 6054]
MSVPNVGKSPVSTSSTPGISFTDTASTPGSSSANPPIATQPIPKKSQQIKTDKPRPHVCTICTRAFARLEHLKRHERSHTNEKPFQCAACGRCFARRDLVLRHQQKLHTSLPNVMRRGSTKDLDNNEHIIVLHNNTSPNAPLPNGSFGDGIGLNVGTSDMSNDSSGYPYSPPRTNDVTYNHPQFRTAMFGDGNGHNNSNGNGNGNGNVSHNSNNNHISNNNSNNNHTTLNNASLNMSPANNNTNNNGGAFSPHPSISNHASPPILASSIPNVSNTANNNSNFQQPSPQSNESPNRSSVAPKPIPAHLQQKQLAINHHISNLAAQYRHASFSAASNISYTNLKDALSIQSHNNMEPAPMQVDFATPQLSAQDDYSRNLLLSGLDLSSYNMMDWNSIDNLDLNEASTTEMSTGAATAKQKSIKNLQHSKNSNGSNLLTTHQFSNPNHPHHIKGTTPFEFGVNPPNDVNIMQQLLEQNGLRPDAAAFSLNTSMIDQKKLQKKKAPQALHPPPVKRTKREDSTTDKSSSESMPISISNNDDDNWLKEIIGTPYDTNFQANNQHMGLFEPPSSPNELTTLFRSRQSDLVNQLKPNFSITQVADLGIDFPFKKDKYSSFSQELRSRIISISNISDSQFPSLEDLNRYMKLYELEFNRYFPFIHLPSLKNPMVDNFENIPLLLSMASIGALYSFHDSNTLLLFNLSKFHIQSFFEKEITLDNLQFKKVPLMAHQCLVLHIFISMFLNEPNMVDITSRQIKSMIGLIKSTNFNEPLEQFLVPPPSILETRAQQLIQNNFDYFIMAQSRIRTLHMFYMLQTFRSSIIGLPIYLNSKFLKNGNYCFNEELWRCEGSQAWFKELSKDNKKTLVELSNGESQESLLKLLKDNTLVNPHEPKLSLNNSLALLIYLHELVQTEISSMKQRFTYLNWKLNHKPKLEHMVRAWEGKFLKNNGTLQIDSYSRYLLNSKNELKLILPLHALLKIKLEVNFNPIIAAILRKDWSSMNSQLNLLLIQEPIHENIRASLPHCFEILQLWIYNIETINYDIKQTSLRSPVFFVACLFVAILLVSTYLDFLEAKFEKGTKFNDRELVDWLSCETIMLKVEKVLSPVLKSSYSEFLTKQAHGAFNNIIDDKTEKIDKLESISKELAQEIKKINLSTKSLYLGIRILADAPIWPIAMGFAEALKNRATYLSSRKLSQTRK